MADSDAFLEVTTPRAVYSQPPCPKCGSKDTSSAAKRPTANSYWRCLHCGGVWNPSQPVAAGSPRQAR